MTKRISIGLALVFAAVPTFGMVHAGPHFDAWRLMPWTTYEGFFAHLLIAIWRVWSHFHGVEPLTHANEFGMFYARFVFLTFPLIGFVVFLLCSRPKIGGQLWKPMAIALLFTTPLEGLITVFFQLLGLGIATAEAVRSVVVLLCMIWSVGAIQIPGLPHKATEDSAMPSHSL